MVHLLEDCNLCAIHAKRVTISTYPLNSLQRSRQKAGCMGCIDLCHVGVILQCRRTCNWPGASEDQCWASPPTDYWSATHQPPWIYEGKASHVLANSMLCMGF